MSSKIGFILSLIGGILIILAGLLVLLFPITPSNALFVKFYTGQTLEPSPPLSVTIGAIIIGLIIVYGSMQMRVIGREKTAGKLVILFSIINLFIIGVGSIISTIGSITGIIGGILGYLEK